MRLSLRFILPLFLVIGLFAYSVVPLVDNLTLKWFIRDLDSRTKLISDTLQDSLTHFIETQNTIKIQALFSRATQNERLYAVGFCSPLGKILYKTTPFPDQIACRSLNSKPLPHSTLLTLDQGPLHVSYQPLEGSEPSLGELIFVHDMSFIQRRSADTKKYIFYLFTVLGVISSLITVLIAQLSLKGWIKGIQSVLKRERLLKPISQFLSPELRPIVKDLRTLIRDLEIDRQSRDTSQISWNPNTLKEVLHSEFAGDEILVVSNREPYVHIRNGDKIEIHLPASGLVTAIEPIMRACSGTWIAHGGGNADKETVDQQDHIQVPPENPYYQIRRVWLTPEEESGYYNGFSNEGLWPLCHIAHTRPIFRTEDWKHYSNVNQKFANVVIEEAKTEDPVILVQDYHFALLPKMIKEKLPNATVITFWHIPWPNAESFGICPWKDELLEGLLGSTILGFHTRFHCNNFIDTVDRSLECRIERETSTISHGGRLTAINDYPISIEYPIHGLKQQKPVEECRIEIRKSNQLKSDCLIGIGVDRLDYTKGILERFRAIDRLLELEPKWIGKFTFIQIASPSRESISHYQNFDTEVRALAAKINQRFAQANYEPIFLKVEQHSATQVYEYFRGADLCFVSSLHDGMNLVAKEFVAARDDEQGVLILSQFTGASRELPEALIVNPYHIDQCAAALHLALEMSPTEQRDRMRSMRRLVQEFNVFRWAGRMLMDASRIRRSNRLKGRFQKHRTHSGSSFPV